MPNGRRGMGRMRGFGAGPGGECMCTNAECGYTMPHERARPCYELKCPKCGSSMVRKS